MALLGPDEPDPVLEFNRQGKSAFVIAVDHASRMIPAALGDLGLAPADLRRHIAWDIGALAVAFRVAQALDAPLVAQNYSRLVIDCNRDPKVASSIPTIGEETPIPGNLDLTSSQIAERRAEIFDPYHAHLRALLDERAARGQRTILVAQHSMTDCFKGVSRTMHGAVLYNRDPRLAKIMLHLLRREDGLIIADNEPYFVADDTDYTIPHHGERRGIPHVELEIRQDLITAERGQRDWAARIAACLTEAAPILPA